MINRGLPSDIHFYRKDMPQVKSKNFYDFLMWSKLMCYVNEPYDITDLRATQVDINEEKVKVMMQRIIDKDPDFKGVITVSQDGYVLDGHHRWLALLNTGHIIARCNVIAANAKDALQYMHDYPNSVRHDLNDSEPLSQ